MKEKELPENLHSNNYNRKIINLGCGNSFIGTHRVDFYKTDTTTHICDLNIALPFPDAYFDEIYCRSVLEHIKNLGIFADECHRILKKGGKLWLRTDHAGFLLAHIWERHEFNRGLDIQYSSGEGFGHEQGKDHHYAVFVPSHLKYLFSKFKDHKFEYIYGGSNSLKNFIYKYLFPLNTGACHIEMFCYKA
jgi:SAM-dependent methyltransferase